MNIKKIFRENIDFISKMDEKEYLLYCKWIEINHTEWGSEERSLIYEIKNRMWEPEGPEDYKNIRPDFTIVDNRKRGEVLTWDILRIFTSMSPYKKPVGRNIRVVVYDRNTFEYLGIVLLSTDYISLRPRDEFIGWTLKDRVEKKSLNHTIKADIFPSPTIQNYYGSRELLFSLLSSNMVIDEWNKRFKEKVVGITSICESNNLDCWHECGLIDIEMPFAVPPKIYNKTSKWLKDRYPKEFEKLKHNKTRVIYYLAEKLGLKVPNRMIPRPVFFCELFTKTKEFLRSEDWDFGNPLFDNGFYSLFKIWKEKVKTEIVENSTFTSSIYGDMISKSWFDVRKKYLEGSSC